MYVEFLIFLKVCLLPIVRLVGGFLLKQKKPLLSVMLLQGLMVTESGDNPYRRLYPVLSAVQSLWMR